MHWGLTMRRIQPRHLGFLAFLILVAIGSISLADGQSQAPTLDRPTMPSVGDSFTYKWRGEIVAMTYLGRDRDLYCYSAKAPGARQSTVCHTSEDNTVRRTGSWEPVTFTPYLPTLSFPLFVGKRWELSYGVQRGSQGTAWAGSVAAAGGYLHEMNANRIRKANVVSYEKVTVPAGTFDAFKIEAVDGPWGQSRSLPLIYYYSPEARFVKFDGEYLEGSHYELLSYSRAK
jgi:hypothetical protein